MFFQQDSVVKLIKLGFRKEKILFYELLSELSSELSSNSSEISSNSSSKLSKEISSS